ncbi:methionyl-tRNA formyltransferase [Govanella unica]|uniref:Methionyl-tRNA formyltransferase n=1 Tax=Govanella unica TaxID=2975056 RepID=A0A9X3TX14_9PROT|nr:methionyl-tRNA formyltransferase [Govania unica]
MRLAFMGTPEFSVSTLRALIDAGHDVVAVYSQPPRPAGRGQKERPSPVAAAAEAAGIPVFTPTSLKSDEETARFQALGLDAAVVVAYGLLLPQAILDAPRMGCVNVHASLLPRWRGAAPIQRAIMAGDAETGITIMGMEAGLDTGPMILIEKTPIAADDTAASLHDRLAVMGAQTINPALQGLADGSLTPVPQPADGVTYAKKIDKAEARLDWSRPAIELDRQIRGLAPFPGAWFEHEGARVKVLGSRLAEGDGAPGTLIAAPFTVACGKGAVALTTLQREGKSAMSAEEFQRGRAIPLGLRLG